METRDELLVTALNQLMAATARNSSVLLELACHGAERRGKLLQCVNDMTKAVHDAHSAVDAFQTYLT